MVLFPNQEKKKLSPFSADVPFKVLQEIERS